MSAKNQKSAGKSYHPLANIFPMMGDLELAELAGDIKKNGLRENIKLLDGKILDGRNRQVACRMAKVEALYEPFNGTDPLEWVLSKNLHRRHLSESQRAMVAAKLANLENGGDRRSDQSANLPTEKTTQTEAASKLNVSTRSVTAAKKVTKDGVPELKAAVESGEVSVNKAAKIAKEEPEVQREAIGNGYKVPEVEVEHEEPEPDTGLLMTHPMLSRDLKAVSYSGLREDTSTTLLDLACDQKDSLMSLASRAGDAGEIELMQVLQNAAGVIEGHLFKKEVTE